MRYIYNWLKRKHSKVFYGFLISYVAVILIPVIIGGFTWFVLMNSFSNEVGRIHKAVLNQVKLTVDEQFNSIERMSQQISINPYVMQLLAAKQPLSTDVNYHIIDIVSELSNAKTVNSGVIDECYIYFGNSDLIINSSTKLSPEMFYRFVSSYKDFDCDGWRRDILESSEDVMYLQQTVTSQSPEYDSVVFVKSLYTGRKKNGKLIIHLKKDYISGLIGDVEDISGSVVCITDSSGKLLFTNAADCEDIAALYEEGVGTVTYKNELWTVEDTFSESLIPDLRYIIFTPEAELTVKVNQMRKKIFVTVVMIVLLGGVFIIFFARRNYEPVKNLISNLEHLNNSKSYDGGEYAYIMESLRSMQEERAELIETVSAQGEIVKEKFLTEVLKGNSEDTLLGSGLDIFGLQNEEAYFRTVVIMRDSKPDAEEISAVKEIAGEAGCVRIDDKLALILSFDSYEDIAEITAKLASGLSDAVSDAYIGIGEIQSGAVNICISYRQALAACAHMQKENRIGVQDYHDMDFDIPNKFYYPVEMEMRIINYIKNIEVSSAKKLLLEIIDENSGRVKPDMRRLFCYNVVCTVNKIIYTAYEEKYRFTDREYCQRLLEAKNDKEFKAILEELFTELERCSDVRRISRSEGLKIRIEDYIAEHYNTTSFSLSGMAEHFNITASYLSRYFKECFGENFNSYISRYKIEKAKEMLVNTNYAVREISALVGYWDVNNFIKNFKRMEGVTPGQYRANRSK